MSKDKTISTWPLMNNQRGVTIILVAILMVVFFGIAALAIDLSHLYVVRNELQNAADAGALAGARFLYNEDGTRVNDAGYTTMDGNVILSANKIAYDAATTNMALAENEGAVAVEVNWPSDDPDHPGEDVQRGHWSFTTDRFTANEITTDPPDLTRPTSTLDTDPNFINAVKVVTRRQASPAASFFARPFAWLLGNYDNDDPNDDWEHFILSAEAIAYIGFAGDLGPGELDQPIAICKQSILFNDAYSCNTGRMLNSGSNTSTSNTGGWTNFSQPCDTADVPSLRPLICGDGNIDSVSFGDGMGAVNGVQDTIFRDLEDCWRDHGTDTVWTVTLPVIDCPGNGVSNCSDLLGAVTLKIVWVQRDNPGYDQVPKEMNDPETGTTWPTDDDSLEMDPRDLADFFEGGGPSDTYPSFADGTTVLDVFYGDTEDSGRVRWASLVRRFNLRNVGPGDTAPYATFAFKSIYFLPSCTPHEPRGNTGGENFGILARIPKLVR